MKVKTKHGTITASRPILRKIADCCNLAAAIYREAEITELSKKTQEIADEIYKQLEEVRI